jgi:DNA segregation ATPase FtsK/SpoIIIE, S-DNA-T family
MTRRRKRKTKQRSVAQRWLAAAGGKLDSLRNWRKWRPELGPMQRDLIGLGLMILAVLTLLGLSNISSGALLNWWSLTLRRTFGWGVYPVVVGFALAGLALIWQDLSEWLPLTPAPVVGLELLLLVLLVASHAPLVIRLGADGAYLIAQQGGGGGYIGWALATVLVQGLGSLVGALFLLALLMVALYLLLSLSWADLWDWARQQSRRVAVAFDRWRLSRQGEVVTPELEEPPWWEQEPDPAEAKVKTGTKRARRKRSKPQPRDGELPSLELLDAASPQAYGDSDVRRRVQIIEETLSSFGVPVQVVEVNQGPTVTQFGLDPGYIERRVAGGGVQQQRVRVGRIVRLANDLALALAAAPIRIEEPVPGRLVVGLEVSNEKISLVSLRQVMESSRFAELGSPLAIALGEDVSGHPSAVDLALMPHLLIAGATGSGKSVCVNAIICSLLFNNRPEDLKMLMVDPKMVELIGYNGVPHLLAPVVIDVEQVVGALAWVTHQMDERYKLFHKAGARNLDQYNQRVSHRKGEDPLPKLVVFIDELADLMMVAPDEVERHVCRLAQMGRATGIHLVIATQRPSVDVVTGLIKANFPARISFAVTSQIDSRVILDQGGAENLLGRGDMLFMSPQQSAPVRLQGCFVSDKEIDRLVKFWEDWQGEGDQSELFPPWQDFRSDDREDSLLDEAIALADKRNTISTSYVQRQLRIGFPRAARLMEQLEEQGIVGPDLGGGRGRKVLGARKVDLDKIAERLPGEEPD